MSENSTTITLKLYHDGPTAGSLDCWVQEPGGPVTSYDPEQLPDRFKALMTTAQKAALTKAANATERAEAAEAAKAEAEARFAAVDGASIEHLRVEGAAKDANIQTLLAENEALRAAEKG